VITEYIVDLIKQTLENQSLSELEWAEIYLSLPEELASIFKDWMALKRYIYYGVLERENFDGNFSSIDTLNARGVILKKERYHNKKLYSILTYNSNGIIVKYESYRFDGSLGMISLSDNDGNVIRYEVYRKDGSLKKIKNTGEAAFKYFPERGTLDRSDHGSFVDFKDDNGKNVYRIIRPGDSSDAYQTVMFTDDGVPYGTLAYERQRNPEMTADDYLDFLAKELDTPEKLYVFLISNMQYTLENQEEFQTAQETVERIRDGLMLGGL